MNNKLSILLDRMKSVSLDDIENVRLMNRQDMKFTISFDKILPVLEKAIDNYSVLEIKGKRILTYKTTYLDTHNWSMYLAHHNNKLNRYKIRYREYLDTETKYLEVKFKNNKDRTIKDRIKIKEGKADTDDKSSKFIHKKTPFSFTELEQKVNNRFSRVTLVNNFEKERITIDFALEFINDDKIILLDDIVIVEIKQEKNFSSEFQKLLHNASIHPFGISKYCLGTILFNNSIKYNRFKRNLLTLNKISNGHIFPHVNN